jgi:hypothetical protein
MFNLGYKEIVLNKLGGVKYDATSTVLTIPGYGEFLKSATSVRVVTPSEPTKQEKVNWTMPSSLATPPDAWGNADNFKVGDVVEVEIKIRSLRNVSSIARDFIVDGKSIVFQSVPVVTADAAGIAAAIAAGYKLSMQNLNDVEIYFDLTSAGDVVTSVVAKGLEHVYVKSMGLKVARHGGLPFFTIVDSATGKNVVDEGSVGLGLGKFIEESRRMATKENVMPYAQSHGGNDQGVDVRGTYTAFTFDFQGENAPDGWQSHEYVDHSYVNAEMSSKPVHYVIYANEADQALIDEITLLFT